MTKSTILQVKVDESQPIRVDSKEVTLIICNNSVDLYSNVNIEFAHRRDIRLYPKIYLERLSPGPPGIKKNLYFQARAAGSYVLRGRANYFVEGRNRHTEVMEVELRVEVKPAMAIDLPELIEELVKTQPGIESTEGTPTTAQIFLSYAREDEAKVENLYQRLSNAGFKPWMAKRDLLPGEQWEYHIPQAIRHSDFFLACLSAKSVTKRGFIQKENKKALDIWQEKLDSDIYLIPVRLEDCDVPESLRKFKWVNLFEEDGWRQLVKAIQVGMERRTT